MYSANEPLDMDKLHEENLNAGREADSQQDGDDDQDSVDRGDVVSEDTNGEDAREGHGEDSGDDSGEDPGENAGEDDGDIDIDALSELAGEEDGADQGQAPAIPAARVGVLAKERSVALSISDGIIDGTIDPEAVKAMGGATAAAKAVVRGEATLDDLANFVPGQQQEGTEGAEERINLTEAWKKYYEAMEDGDDDAAEEIMKKIEAEQRRLIREEAKAIAEESLSKREKEAEMLSAEETAQAIMNRHEELQDDDSVELEMFRVAVSKYQAKGIPLKDAFVKAEKKVFPGAGSDDDSDEDKGGGSKDEANGLSQRELAARLKNARAAAQQPPVMEKGSGLGAAQAQKKVSEMTEEEFDRLSEREKARLRGDIVS